MANEDGAAQLRGKTKVPGAGLMVLARPRATRAKAPKTRSGCRECKRRRVKCDETRPSCKRCVLARRTCDFSLVRPPVPFPGVPKAEDDELSECSELTTTSSSSTTTTTNTTATTTTATTRTTPPSSSSTSHLPHLPQEPSYILSLFSSQHQHDLFAVFLFSNSQAGTLPVNTLSALTPQLAHASPAVREMCCAIGAAAAAFTVPGTPASVDEVQYEASLRHYNRALRAVRAAVPDERGDALLTVALVSMLFVTYDMLRGDMRTAFAHFSHGRRIIDSYFDARCRDAGRPLSQLRLSTLEAAVFEMLQRLTTHPWVLHLDHDQRGTRLHHRELSRACCRGGRHRGRVRDLPESFRDLAAALRWWDVVQHFLLHQIQTPSSSPETSPDPSEPSPSSTPSPMPDTTWNASLSALRSWHNSFAPLLQSARLHKSADPCRYLNACTLETLYLESLTSLHARHGSNNSNSSGGSVDVLPDVRSVYLDMVQTTRQMQQRYARSTFLDNAIMRPLTYVVYKCGDAHVREGIREVLEGSVGASHMAAPLRSMMDRKRGEPVPEKMRNIERAMGWYFTSCGVTQVL